MCLLLSSFFSLHYCGQHFSADLISPITAKSIEPDLNNIRAASPAEESDRFREHLTLLLDQDQRKPHPPLSKNKSLIISLRIAFHLSGFLIDLH